MDSTQLEFPQQQGPEYRYRQVASIVLVLVLQCGLAFLLIWGLRSSPPPKTTPILVVIDVPATRIKPKALPMRKFVAPRKSIVALPQFEVTPEHQAALSPAQGPMDTLEGGGGNGGFSTRRDVALPLPLDPNCETIQAYAKRVRDHLQLYMSYSLAAKMMRIEGVITMNFMSDPAGHVLTSSITGSHIVRTVTIHDLFGVTRTAVFDFTRIAPDKWNFTAVALLPESGKIVPVDKGIAIADSDGVLKVEDRPMQDPTSILVTFPAPTDTVAFQKALPVKLGTVSDMELLEEGAKSTLRDAQPLPPIPSCLKLQSFNASVPLQFALSANLFVVR